MPEVTANRVAVDGDGVVLARHGPLDHLKAYQAPIAALQLDL